MNRISPTVKQLLIINIIFYFGSSFSLNTDFIYSLFSLHFPENPEFKFWQLLTHMFMHGGIMHLAFNMFALWMFGSAIESIFGSRIIKFIIIILALSTLTATLIAGYEFEMNINFNQTFPIDTTGIIFLIAFMGWMPAPLDVSVWHSIWALEKKKTIKNYSLKNSMFDFNVGYIGTAILGICFICLGYFVMYGTGETFSESAGAFSNQLIEMYTKSLGNWSYYIIGIAAFSTMLSTTITTLDASPRAMSETTELIFNKKNNYGYLIWLAILALGTIIIFFVFSSQMGLLIKIATILSFLTAPFYAIMNYLLISSKHTPKKNRPSKKMHILSILGIIYLLGFSVFFLTKGV